LSAVAPEDHGDRARRLTHEPGLDGLRGVAVLLVVVYHIPDILQPVPFVPTFNGTLGVDLFFVLSGFLITAILISEHDRHGRIRVGSFYLRRALRLLRPSRSCSSLRGHAWATQLDSPTPGYR
jgi:peptidoglycan/LPS O-acetylase OafA/YrhL